MNTLFHDYRFLSVVICCLITLSLFSYFFVNSNKNIWFKYYWKGFLLISIGCVLFIVNLLLPLPKPFELIRKVITLLLALFGFFLILLGGKKKSSVQKEK